ncbi:acyl-CoA N-acyltransferase [Cristinia sonorae]|uniref:histone acetyltransferase n=1 Tax=Cristinia sonorae TaxID=1940300 RepID=A0A8K0UPY1_9AGAR|nr:acyl-CoA N-acyltransferase [Cristinia sonorae]
MPQTFQISDSEPGLFIVKQNGAKRFAYVLERRPSECYVHYHNTDKRLDEWVPESAVRPAGPDERPEVDSSAGKKRKRGSVVPEPGVSRGGSEDRASVMRDESAATPGESSVGGAVTITEEEYDIQHHKQITAKRNFDKVIFGKWQIKTWYFSPYPLIETELPEDPSTPTPSGQSTSATRIPGVARSTVRTHGRTSDLFAGGLNRTHGAMLWVCDKCFKYMADGASWELHTKKCTRKSPPGRKVYQRGAHIIWEVDGAKEKLYCQNLSLFGKLFIDIKTLFFDCDNFLFYILTDADSQRDHVLGFFSKEKISYDDYNLACIVVLPPYQKKGYGMLMIEFSYELSRRAGKIGTPERPLSDLGLRSYLTYWVSTLLRFFRRLLSVLPADTPRLIAVGINPFSPSPMTYSNGIGTGADPTPESNFSPEPDDTASNANGTGPRMRRRKSTKGWDGEVQVHNGNGNSVAAHKTLGVTDESDPLFNSLRTIETIANPDGSATSHIVVNCTLADIARATGLRIEDTAFALNECGLLSRRRSEEGEDGEEEFTMIVTREMVESVAKERNAKRMCMDLAHVLL